jgi:hypothetical protein
MAFLVDRATFWLEYFLVRFLGKACAKGLAKKLGKMFLPVTAIWDFLSKWVFC